VFDWLERGQADAVEATVAALKANLASPALQERGAQALATLTLMESNKGKAGRAGAVEAIVATMQQHVSDASVMEPCCRALCNMTDNNDGNSIKAGSAGAVECVVAAMRAHADKSFVQQWGRFLLARLGEARHY
jgi:mevalonate kinase